MNGNSMNDKFTEELAGFIRDAYVSEATAEEAADRLGALYAKQTELDDRIVSQRGVDKTMDEWVIGLTIAMESEIDEIRREVNWKWWKNEKDIDYEALQGEIIDMWHFLLSLSRRAGLGPEDIYRIYMEKNAENHDRQSGNSDKVGYAYEKAVEQNGEALRKLARREDK